MGPGTRRHLAVVQIARGGSWKAARGDGNPLTAVSVKRKGVWEQLSSVQDKEVIR